ncbi:MAG: hypothetical protein J6M34_02705 [Clostridia bacterium]|nr:hypothetical protein [Clostridia bacterium]
MIRKHHEKRRREYTQIIVGVLPDDARLMSLEYFPRLFEADFEIEITQNDIVHVFRSAKGWIYHNNELICESGYQYLEKASTFEKMLDIIKQTLT